MKLRFFLIGIALFFLLEIGAIVLFAISDTQKRQDTVAVNRVVQSVSAHFGQLNASVLYTELEYVVTDRAGNVLFRTKEGLSETLNEAIAHRDTILDITVGEQVVGKVFIANDSATLMASQRKTLLWTFAGGIFAQCLLCGAYFFLLNRNILKPFRKLRAFATHVADGDLDLPLTMDRNNVFGAFTESFDLMRTQLKAARNAEAAANESKKELIAKLSHDIKTPVASIKAVSEIGAVTAANEKDRDGFIRIGEKADQINVLVSDLFHASLQELQQLGVNPKDHVSGELREMIEKSDYYRRAEIGEVPSCLLSYDKLRLQQVFDNIFINSYKYADTEMLVTFTLTDAACRIRIEDYGGGVREEELPHLLEKFKRGENATGKDGAGLGLYLSQYLASAMGGGLEIENSARGFAATVSVAMSGSGKI